jgi:hypothetical protein
MVFGTPQAINSAGYQINIAMKEVMKLGDARCLDIFSGRSITIFKAFQLSIQLISH